MIRSLRTYGYLFGYLPFSLGALKKVRALPDDLPVDERDRIVAELPIHWATNILKRTKSTFHVEGEEYLPEGPVLFVSNHEGNFDIPTLLVHIPKPFGFISKVEVKKLPVIRDWMEEMNCVFLDRTDRRSAMRVLSDSVAQLEAGHSIIIFPEGTRSKGGPIQSFKPGFAKIAKDAGVPVVPIAVRGTSDIMEKNNNRIRPAHVDIRILPPIDAETVESLDRKALVAETERRVKEAVERLDESR